MDQREQASGPPGIYVRGKVVRRSRKRLGDEGTEVVTYAVLLDTAVVDVDDWEPDTYHDIGDVVEMSVEVRAFTSKAGRVCVSLQRLRGRKGEF